MTMQPLDNLTEAFSRLPGIGRKSAERIAFRLASSRDSLVQDLIVALREAGEKMRSCSICGSMTVVGEDPCRLCGDATRDGSILYVVENASDVLAIERSGGVRGRYHVLGGKISPTRGRGPWDLHLEALLKRIDDGACEEVVLALGTDMESDATASFIHDLLADRDVKVTRLAQGLPVGSGIAYSDPVTLERAIKGRYSI